MSSQYDVAVIGGGIVGLAASMALIDKRKLSLVVLEAEKHLAAHQTGNNSGVIHSGLYYKPGSLKAKNCVEGRKALYSYLKENEIPHDRCGKIVVAVTKEQIPALNELESRGIKNGLKGIKRLTPDMIRRYEPHIKETGITDYKQVAHSYGDQVKERGGEILTGARVTGFQNSDKQIRLQTSIGEVKCKYLVNCAGLYSDRIARMCGLKPKLIIVPFRGEYYELKPESSIKIRNLVYPVPDPRFPFLGVHFTRMVSGGVEAGPNAVLAFKREGYSRFSFSLEDAGEFAFYPGFWRMAGKYWKTGMGEVYRSFIKTAFVKALKELAPQIRCEDLKRGGAGVRAQALLEDGAMVDDFCIEEGERMIHVLNAPSPAATASISIGRTIAEKAAQLFNL